MQLSAFPLRTLGAIVLVCQLVVSAPGQDVAAGRPDGLPCIVIEMTEITTDAASLGKLTTVDGSEFDATLKTLVDAGVVEINRTYRLTATNGQTATMMFGQRVPVVTGVVRAGPANLTRENVSLENYGTTVEAVAFVQGETVALNLKYESSRQIPAAEGDGDSSTRPTTGTQSLNTVVPLKLNQSTLVVATSQPNERSLLVKVSTLPIFVREIAEVPRPSANRVGAAATEDSNVAARNEQVIRRAESEVGAGEPTTRVRDMRDIPDAQRRQRIARQVLERLDRDGNGVVSPDELPQMSADRFNELDRDRNGSIDAEELRPQ